MHTLGKVFLGVTAVLAIAAVLLTSKLINIRNSWMAKVEANATRIEGFDGQIEQKRKELASLRDQLTRQRLAWDKLDVSPAARPEPNGQVTVQVGPAQGFGVVAADQAKPIVHAFAMNGAESIYIGPFQVTAGQQSQSMLTPLFQVEPTEPANWPTTNWHLWQQVPSDAPTRLVDLKGLIARKTENRDSRQATLALQTRAVQEAEEQLQSHVRELFGNDQAPQLERAPELRQGLVAALADAERGRNEKLAELDRLRHRVDENYRRLTDVVAANRQLVQGLPQPEPAATASAR